MTRRSTRRFYPISDEIMAEMVKLDQEQRAGIDRKREAIAQALRILEARPTCGYSVADVDASAWAAAEVLRAALLTDEQYHDAQQDAASL